MNLDSDFYVPSLRWRMGEYQALFKLADSVKDRIVPFIVIPEVEFDFEDWAPKKTIQDHVAPFPKRYQKKWGMRPAWIDVHPAIGSGQMANGSFPIEYVFEQLRFLGSLAVPVTSLDVDHAVNIAVAKIIDIDKRGVAIRARIEHVMKPDFSNKISQLLIDLQINPDHVDLIIDLGSPNFEPYEDFANALLYSFKSIKDLPLFRSFVLISCAFPEKVPLAKPGGILPRHDWAFFKTVRQKLLGNARIPNYGDYTIVNPEFTPQDMRKIKSGGKVVYTTANSWLVKKGGAFRDNPGQMHGLCMAIVVSGQFMGASFSDGDKYIEQCANQIKGPSNQPRWKQVAINHHITHVLHDISNLNAGP